MYAPPATKILALARASPHSTGVEEEPSSSRERTGLFTSGIVSTRQGQRIALFFTGQKHAGENLAQVLAHRAAESAPPIQMCDALSRNLPNLPQKLEMIVGFCLAHSRRRFVNVVPSFPEECRYVLEALGEVYGYDAQAEEQGLSPEERPRFHPAQSAPVMEKLHAWLRTQFEEKKVEPNSGLGEAIRLLVSGPAVLLRVAELLLSKLALLRLQARTAQDVRQQRPALLRNQVVADTDNLLPLVVSEVHSVGDMVQRRALPPAWRSP
jgi:hypothetical protein